jgi:hypothetical protein
MAEAVLLLGVFVSAYFGMAALALSQHRHWHHSGGGRHCPRRTRVALRVAGGLLLLAALVLALVRDGSSFGAVLWTTILTIGGVCLVATLSWRAHWLHPLVRVVRFIGRGRPLPS